MQPMSNAQYRHSSKFRSNCVLYGLLEKINNINIENNGKIEKTSSINNEKDKEIQDTIMMWIDENWEKSNKNNGIMTLVDKHDKENHNDSNNDKNSEMYIYSN